MEMTATWEEYTMAEKRSASKGGGSRGGQRQRVRA